MKWITIALITLVGVLGVMSASAGTDTVIHVPGDYPLISEALDAAPDGATIEIAVGRYDESLLIERPITLRADGSGDVIVAGADDAPVITVENTETVTIEGLQIVGGSHGIFVTHSHDIIIQQNVIAASRLTGVTVRLGAADIVENTIVEMQPPYGRGVHITNTTEWPESRVIGNMISGNALSGITTNMVGMIRIEDNTVIGNGQSGIAVTEMSHALVANNTVTDNIENGIYVSDMSMAMVCDNTVTNTNTLLPMIEGGARYGNGITVDFHSDAELHRNSINGNFNYGISIMLSSHTILGENIFSGNGVDTLWLGEYSQSRNVPRSPAECN